MTRAFQFTISITLHNNFNAHFLFVISSASASTKVSSILCAILFSAFENEFSLKIYLFLRHTDDVSRNAIETQEKVNENSIVVHGISRSTGLLKVWLSVMNIRRRRLSILFSDINGKKENWIKEMFFV